MITTHELLSSMFKEINNVDYDTQIELMSHPENFPNHPINDYEELTENEEFE